jgi:hypothetical protein
MKTADDDLGPPKIGIRPRFVTLQELAEASQLEAELQKILAHSSATTYESLRGRYREAVARYKLIQSDENLAVLIAASIARENYSEYQRPRSVIHVVYQNFLLDRLVPFLAPILERGVKIAREHAQQIREQEDLRTRQLIGQPLAAQSQIVEEATRPLSDLQDLVRHFSPDGIGSGLIRPPRPIVKTLQKYAVEEDDQPK